MVREAIYHRYEYPNFVSRLKTYFLKLLWTYSFKYKVWANFYAGETWFNLLDIQIGEDNIFTYTLEIEQAEWCKQIQILIIRDFKQVSD
jgi:hypothetical protein